MALFNPNWGVSIKINQPLNKAYILSLIKTFKIQDIYLQVFAKIDEWFSTTISDLAIQIISDNMNHLIKDFNLFMGVCMHMLFFPMLNNLRWSGPHG
ncbi:hypothetical protein VTN02DRAFT_5681 [Thermoascus thermophilus]